MAAIGPVAANRVTDGWHDRVMSVVKINAITVPEDSGDELARRFAARAGAVDDQEGFEGFELLKPVDERTTWLVVTRWRDEEAFQAWLTRPPSATGTAPPRSGAAARRPSRSACTARCGPTRSRAVRPVPQVDRPVAERDFLRGTQYKTDANLAARQSIYAYQHPRIDLQARVLDLAAPAPSDTIVDVGCGNGTYLATLARRGFAGRVLGVDLSLGMLTAARQRLSGIGAAGHARHRTVQPSRRFRSSGSPTPTRPRCRWATAWPTWRSRRTCSTTCPTRLTRSASCAG